MRYRRVPAPSHEAAASMRMIIAGNADRWAWIRFVLRGRSGAVRFVELRVPLDRYIGVSWWEMKVRPW